MYKIAVIILLILILFSTCTGCTFMIAKETAKAISIVLEDDPNATKKEKIVGKQNRMKEKAREFYCSKVHDEEKCGTNESE